MNYTLNPKAKPFYPDNYNRNQTELVPSFLLDNDIDKYFHTDSLQFSSFITFKFP